MAYYYDHKSEIDRQIAESRAWFEEIRNNTPPSPLEARLRAIRSE